MGTLAPARGVPRTWRVRAQPLLAALRLGGVALLIVAIARPQAGEAASQTKRDGIDIVLAFDISSSMSQPYARGATRIDAAKEVLSSFVASRENDRVGLVVFQGASLTMSPLTIDYSALRQEVKDANSVRLKDGTAIGVAIGQSVNLLRNSKATSRIVILLTDGENNEHTIEPLAAARIAERLGIRVYPVGVVSPPAPGRPGNMEVDEKAMQEIADVTGGTYNRAENPEALAETYRRIDDLEKSRVEGTVVRRFDDIAPYFLAAAAAAFALELALRHSLLRRAA